MKPAKFGDDIEINYDRQCSGWIMTTRPIIKENDTGLHYLHIERVA